MFIPHSHGWVPLCTEIFIEGNSRSAYFFKTIFIAYSFFILSIQIGMPTVPSDRVPGLRLPLAVQAGGRGGDYLTSPAAAPEGPAAQPQPSASHAQLAQADHGQTAGWTKRVFLGRLDDQNDST